MIGQVSIVDGSFTSLEQNYNPANPPSEFNNPVANLTNGHVYLFPPIQPGVTIPDGGYYSDLIKVQTDLGLFSGGLPAGGNLPTATTPDGSGQPYQAPYQGDGLQQGDGSQQYASDPSQGGGAPGGDMGGGGGDMSGGGGGDMSGGDMGGGGGGYDPGAGGGGYDPGAGGGYGDGGAAAYAMPGMPALPPDPTLSGVAAPTVVTTPSGVALDPATLQAMLQSAAAQGAAQASVQALAGQLATDDGSGIMSVLTGDSGLPDMSGGDLG